MESTNWVTKKKKKKNTCWTLKEFVLVSEFYHIGSVQNVDLVFQDDNQAVFSTSANCLRTTDGAFPLKSQSGSLLNSDWFIWW